MLEGSRTVAETERHDEALVVAGESDECSLPLINFPDAQQIVVEVETCGTGTVGVEGSVSER